MIEYDRPMVESHYRSLRDMVIAYREARRQRVEEILRRKALGLRRFLPRERGPLMQSAHDLPPEKLIELLGYDPYERRPRR